MQGYIPSYFSTTLLHTLIQVGNSSTGHKINLVHIAHGLDGQRMVADRVARGLWVQD